MTQASVPADGPELPECVSKPKELIIILRRGEHKVSVDGPASGVDKYHVTVFDVYLLIYLMVTCWRQFV